MLNAVIGPSDGVSTDNAIVRWDGTNGRLVQNSTATLSDAGALALPVGGSIAISNVAGANGEQMLGSWVANVYTIDVTKSGSGTFRNLKLNTGACAYTAKGTLAASSGLEAAHLFEANVSQSGTGGYTVLRLNLTATSIGSGAARLIRAEVGGATRFSVDSGGGVDSIASIVAHSATAIPAGGTQGAGFRFSSTTLFGVFFGSGAPTLSAAKGSLYLRSDGSGTTDRAYINTDGGTTWTAITTVA